MYYVEIFQDLHVSGKISLITVISILPQTFNSFHGASFVMKYTTIQII